VKNGEHLRMTVVRGASMVGTPPDAFASGSFAHPTHWMADYAFANPPYGLRPMRRT
jgi:hypothetical protein